MYSKKYISTILLFVFGFSAGYGQMDKNSELFVLLKQKDSQLFNAAFNTCEPETLKALFTEDFEFYHDKGGLTEGRETFLTPVYRRCENWSSDDLQPAKRFLVENSLEVYPMYKNGELYGAIQHGIHRFEFLNEKKEYQKGDIAKFTHVWIKENDSWRIKREISYDHQPSIE